MKSTLWTRLLLVIVGTALAGCTMNIDSPQTPTVAVSPTPDQTQIALRATRTPTPSRTPTITPSPTTTPSVTPSLTGTATATLTPTVTASATASATPTPTVTASPTKTATATASPTRAASSTPTATASATASRTSTATPTALPTATPLPTITVPPPTDTPAPTLTLTASRTPTEAIAVMQVPTATPRATLTFTPFPSITPNLTSTWIAENVAESPTPTPGGIYTLVSTATAPPTLTPGPQAVAGVPTGDGTFYDPNASASSGQDTLPVAPAGQSGPSGPAMPEQSYIVVSYAGQVVPLLPIPGGIGVGSPLAAGDVFAVSGSGAVAAVGSDRWLYVNNAPVTVSPASRFGVPDNLSFGAVTWSPDGQRIAIRVDAANPDEQNAIDSGVWVYEPATNRSWQVFRNTYQAAQLGDQRRAVSVEWAPNSLALVVRVDTPLGPANVPMVYDHQANDPLNAIPYANAIWTPDSTALIVSGPGWGSSSVVTRIAMDAFWTSAEYLNQSSTGLIMQYAAPLLDGRIAFLGGTTGDSFALYVVQPGGLPVQMSGLITGQIVSAEWNASRSAVLVTVQTAAGYRLWVVRTDGTAADTTPTAGGVGAAHWR